jgi:hypothetical protein
LFTKLNEGWNAEPSDPCPAVSVEGRRLTLTFALNSYLYSQFAEGDKAEILFDEFWRYRLGKTNDEGWYRGQCRFSGISPKWGEFYSVDGDLRLDKAPNDWVTVGEQPDSRTQHFLFYFRDNTFECDAKDWALSLPAGDS